jgi:phage shock protein A
VEDEQLQARLDDARQHVAEQRERLRSARRRLRELEAAASARSDRATAGLLRAQGHPSPEPPVPPHPPGWLADPEPDSAP